MGFKVLGAFCPGRGIVTCFAMVLGFAGSHALRGNHYGDAPASHQNTAYCDRQHFKAQVIQYIS